ncbi:MAG TPA: hemerythrin domain-containing protein [Vicinamibacterales bacterium]|nr:hemerythrin domain-containing protein [Vicinamibacterales bacterium]
MALHIGQPVDHSFDEPLGLLSDCHRRIEHFLTVLRTYASLPSHSLTREQKLEIQDALAYFENAAPRHTADEERSLFPRLRQSDHPDARKALEVLERLERDHEIADLHHRAIDELWRRRLALEELPPQEMQELRDRLGVLQAIYREHITAEDNEVFPTAARVLSRSELLEVGMEMAGRRRRESDESV